MPSFCRLTFFCFPVSSFKLVKYFFWVKFEVLFSNVRFKFFKSWFIFFHNLYKLR
nr:MAG TPA: hypothetical protein [Caudoviricetes sp.]